MVISAKKILELNGKHKLIENLAERELNPEGVGLDVRAGEIYSIDGEGFLGVTERKTPAVSKFADVKTGSKHVVLRPGDFVLVKTMEKLNVPAEKIVIEEGGEPVHVMVDIYPRSTLQRCGIYFMGRYTDPGYSGELTVALKNVGNSDFVLELGARFASVVFSAVLGDLSRAYGGQWKGGRVATGEKEKQV